MFHALRPTTRVTTLFRTCRSTQVAGKNGKKMLPATYNTYGNMRSNAIQLNATLSRNKLEEKVANITKPLRYLYETLSSCLT